jgi:aspartate 1-decarboxylase
MPTVSSLNQYSFAFNGYVFGGTNSPHQVLSVEGLEALPGIRNQDDNQGYQDGMFTGTDLLAGRTITVTINTFGNSSTRTISAATATGTGVITYTTSAAHNLITGQLVTITGVISTSNPTGTAGVAFNQTLKACTVLSSTQFTIAVTLTDTRTSGGTMTMSSSAQQNYNLLQQNLLPQTSGTTPLQFQMANNEPLQRVNARVRQNNTAVDPNYTYGYILSQYSFFCADPRYYDDTLQTASITISTSLGRTYNRIYPLTYGGGSSAITTNVTNAGWATTYPTITINGPIYNPTIGSLTQGKYITITGSFSNTDVIVVDLGSKLVTLNGATARNLLSGTSNWFSAQSGLNQIYLTGTGTLAGTTSATIEWRNAYI